MKTIHYLILVFMAMVIFISSCQQQKETKNLVQESTSEKGDVFLSRDKVDRAGILFGVIKPVLLSYDVSARGQVIVPPQSKATVSVMIGGIIRDIFVEHGERVKKGQVLASYSHPDFIRIQQHYLTARNQFLLIGKEYERQKKLMSQNIKSEKEFQATESAYFQAQSELNAAEAELSLLGIDIKNLEKTGIEPIIRIKSPISGVVDNIYANIGMYADMQQTLFEVINSEELLLQVKVFEKDIPFIKPGQRITFGFSDDESEEYEAYIDNIGSTVDPEGRVITVLATVKTKGLTLMPGMFVSSRIHTSEEMRDALPENALIIDNDEETYGFYTLDELDSPNLSFYKFNVKTGFMEDGFIHVIPDQPLPKDAMIALNGVYYLKSEMLKMISE